MFFVVRHGPSWRWTDQILKFRIFFLEGFRTLGNCMEKSPSIFWLHSLALTAKNNLPKLSVGRLPGNKDNLRKIHCQVIQRYSIRDLFYPLGGGHLTFFLGGHKNHHPKKVTMSRSQNCQVIVSSFSTAARLFQIFFLDNDMIHLSFIQFPSCRCALVPSSHNITPNILEDLGPP